MTLASPTYSKDPVIDGFEHLGHWLHLAEHDTIGIAVTVIHNGVVVAESVKEQLPTLGTETAQLAGDVLKCKAFAAAVALCVAGGGLNLAADAGVLGALVTDGPAIIQAFEDGAKLLKTVEGDVSTDAKELIGG